jgi:hypothetical protein
MTGRKIALYYAWSRPEEVGAPLAVIDNRFPTLFESRRMAYPRLEELSDTNRFAQGIAGFLDHIMKRNFAAFVAQASAQTGNLVGELERVEDDGKQIPLDDALLGELDTLIVISFDSLRSRQRASEAEIRAAKSFLAKRGNLMFVCLHHDIGDAAGLAHDERLALQTAHFLHHGDRTIPPQQGFGGFGRSLLAGLGIPVENRFGLRPASEPDGTPAAIDVAADSDRLALLTGVPTFNLHPHLPHFERLEGAVDKLDVLARQRIDLAAPPHQFTQGGRSTFDAMLQSRRGVFAGDVVVADTTLWSSTAGGVESLRRFWANVASRQIPS